MPVPQGYYDLHFNGQRITEDYFNTGWTTIRKRILYNTLDVTRLLAPGPNTLGAIISQVPLSHILLKMHC